MKDPKTKKKRAVEMTFAAFLSHAYSLTVRQNQPMLEAHAEKPGERVFLIPEFCAICGLSSKQAKPPKAIMQQVRFYGRYI